MGAVELIQRFVEKSGSAAGERRNDLRSTTSKRLMALCQLPLASRWPKASP